MKSSPPPSSVRRSKAAGFTLVEMMVAVAAGLLLIGAVVSLGIFTSRSFYMMGNYTNLDAESRNAVDILGREIRNSSQLTSYGTGNPAFLQLNNASAGTSDIIVYNSTLRTLVLYTINNSTSTVVLNKTLLTNCDIFNFSIYNRAPNVTSTNITFYAATNASACKVINFSWKCSRTIFGTKLNTESVQTAQINLRNKTN
jgi:prepilin-type N-terminal cleavage/methylation domain-containing protein